MLINLKLKQFILFFFIFLIIGCSGNSDKAAGIFKEFLVDPIPETVTIISGKRNDLVDFSASVIFKTDWETFKTLTEGYTQIPMETALIQAEAWLPEDVKSNPQGFICFFRKEIKDGKKQEFYLIWSKKTEEDYFNTFIY